MHPACITYSFSPLFSLKVAKLSFVSPWHSLAHSYREHHIHTQPHHCWRGHLWLFLCICETNYLTSDCFHRNFTSFLLLLYIVYCVYSTSSVSMCLDIRCTLFCSVRSSNLQSTASTKIQKYFNLQSEFILTLSLLCTAGNEFLSKSHFYFTTCHL